MSVKYANKHNSFCDIFSSFILIVIIFASIYFVPVGALNSTEYSLQRNIISKLKGFSRLFKRESARSCLNNSECEAEMFGSVCIENKCMCPQGFLPNERGTIGCLRFGNAVGSYCNVSSQCGIELDCRNNVCLCHEGFQLFQSHGINMCLMWHKPTRILERCRLNEDCTLQDVNTVCKKRWCQCNNGYQMFETMLFGRKQKCFKTFQYKCHNSSQCSKVAESPDQYCMCYYGVCHCMADINSTALDIPNWSSQRPNWYHRWKKDLILATRLLFITVILFFVPCFIYVTLGVRERSRQLFSQIVQPSRSPAVHYSQRRSSNLRSLRSYRGLSDIGPSLTSPVEAHHVEISLHPNGVNSRLVENRPRGMSQSNCDFNAQETLDLKEEDPPPSYDEIMRRDMYSEAPPPPYRDL